MVSVTTVARRYGTMPQAEFAGRASPAWIRCRFFGKEGNKQRLDFPLTPSPTRGEAPGVVATDGLAERVSAGTLFNRVTHKEIFSQTLCTHSATHIRSRGRP